MVTKIQMPTAKKPSSMMTVAATEFQSESPTLRSLPGQTGRSGVWLMKSKTQWLITRMAIVMASRREHRVSLQMAIAASDQTAVMPRL